MYNVFTSSVVGLRLLPAAVFIYCQETRRGGANARPDVAFLFVFGVLFPNGKNGVAYLFSVGANPQPGGQKDRHQGLPVGCYPLFPRSARVK